MSNDQEAEAADAEDAEAPGEDVTEPAENADAEAPEVPEDSEAPEAPEESEGSEGGFEDGDFVRLEYTIRTADEGDLVDTTHREVAEDEGVDVEDQEFGPRTIVLGAGHVFEQVEEDIRGKEVGDSGSVEVPAPDAFGEYDPDQMRTVSADKIPEDDRYPGAHVNIDGQHGHVETIIGGRARVDFNHPLAGEDIVYEYEIVGAVEDRVERAQGLIEMYVDLDLEMYIDTETEEEPVYDDEGEQEDTETVEYETLYIEATPQLSMNQQWLFQKQQIAQELTDRVGVDRVVVREVLGGGGMGGLGGMMGGMGGVGGLEEAVEGEDLEDVDAEEIVEELDIDGEAVEDVEAGDAADAADGE